MLLCDFTEADTHVLKVGQLWSQWAELTSIIHVAISECNNLVFLVFSAGSGNRTLNFREILKSYFPTKKEKKTVIFSF